jgi:required for meiotic nuclear division protein 1
MQTNQGTSDRPVLRALLLGQRLETRGLEHQGLIALTPLTLRVGQHGLVFLFRYGVAVFFRVPAVEEEEVVRSLRSRIVEPLETPEIEQVAISLQSGADDQVEPAGGVALRDASPERLQIVANVLSKSAVLAHHESQIAATFDRIEPLAVGIKRRGRVDREARQLIQQMGDILLTQHRMVGRVEIEDKPDILWDRPELERTYARLEDEYELLERSRAIDRKLTLVGETVRIVLELVQDQRGVRLEWYIIGLIVIEVLLSMYQIAFPVH